MGSDVDGLYGWMWILWLLSFMWIGGHIWRPKSRRLASTEQMFGTPYYSGLLIDTSMIFNRRSDKGACDFRLDFHSDSSPASPPMSQHNSLKHAEVGGLTLPNGMRPTNTYSQPHCIRPATIDILSQRKVLCFAVRKGMLDIWSGHQGSTDLGLLSLFPGSTENSQFYY